jgi:hypothetical protein
MPYHYCSIKGEFLDYFLRLPGLENKQGPALKLEKTFLRV